jgi:hypothetical protein
MLIPRLEAALASMCAVLAVLTTIWPRWIESLTGLDPDGGDGLVEWSVVALLAVVALTMGLLARKGFRVLDQRRRMQTAGASYEAKR